MLGGNYWVSLFRNGIGVALMMAVFLMLDKPRPPMKRARLYYGLFGLLLAISFSAWYQVDLESFVHFGGSIALVLIGVFCALLSGDGVYLSLYKISLGFYLLCVCVYCGVDFARWLFHGNMWADLLIRLLILIGVLFAIALRFRKFFFENVEFLRKEMGLQSVSTLIVSFLMAVSMAYLPLDHSFSLYNMVRMLVMLLMAGLIQYLILYLYIHLGRMHSYRTEKQLLEMNERFLRRQLELEQRDEEEVARIRHDMRHHCMLIREYAKKKDMEGLLAYLEQYREDVEDAEPKRICANKSVDGILSAYASHAKKENIRVIMDASIEVKIAVRDIDLVAILANIFENAIQGCLSSGKQDPEIRISIVQKAHKLVVQCSNSSAENIRFRKGLPQADRGNSQGVLSIVKTAARYNGETDFLLEDGRFIVRVLLNLY